MSYPETIKYLESFVNYEKVLSFDYKESLKLQRIKSLSAQLGNPHLDLKCIHISGTKGKGSTSAMVASILKEAGYRVGLYTSPHLISFRERIRINDELITEEELDRLVGVMRPVIDRIDKEDEAYPTFFEAYTALAFMYFKQKKTDFCIFEVGMGGRLDATNIIERPLCCGITGISLEHTQKLGNTVAEIAAEKAGIIKDLSICVSSPQEPSAMEVIRKACKAKNNTLYEVGRDIRFKKEENRRFSVEAVFRKYPHLEVGLIGYHQFINASTAIGLVESLRFYDIMIKPDAVIKGLKNVKWPGRLEILKRKPLLVLDGAQNRASAQALRLAIQDYFNYKRLILVLGISKDKDIKGICDELAPVSDEIILTRADVPRAEEPAVLANFIKKHNRVTSSSKEAIEMAEASAGNSDLILVAGSLFLVGEVLKNETKS
ncbi:MAG: bifunctional folylpolyglutamate synthase/dihydrofolate synthase [Candidatus Omnitrophica bacterium]|nr:bifunctional folylpolyglutamate synthase/dihydrofolate synthase [Candidatus Omnitrophota bacterium]